MCQVSQVSQHIPIEGKEKSRLFEEEQTSPAEDRPFSRRTRSGERTCVC